MNPSITDRRATDGPMPDWLEVVCRNVAHLRFGSVQITVHDGRVTQVESTEKTRFATSRDDAKTTRK